MCGYYTGMQTDYVSFKIKHTIWHKGFSHVFPTSSGVSETSSITIIFDYNLRFRQRIWITFLPGTFLARAISNVEVVGIHADGTCQSLNTCSWDLHVLCDYRVSKKKSRCERKCRLRTYQSNITVRKMRNICLATCSLFCQSRSHIQNYSYTFKCDQLDWRLSQQLVKGYGNTYTFVRIPFFFLGHPI